MAEEKKESIEQKKRLDLMAISLVTEELRQAVTEGSVAGRSWATSINETAQLLEQAQRELTEDIKLRRVQWREVQTQLEDVRARLDRGYGGNYSKLVDILNLALQHHNIHSPAPAPEAASVVTATPQQLNDALQSIGLTAADFCELWEKDGVLTAKGMLKRAERDSSKGIDRAYIHDALTRAGGLNGVDVTRERWEKAFGRYEDSPKRVQGVESLNTRLHQALPNLNS